MTNRLLIHVIEVPVNERGGKSPERGSADAPRDLLPWADPYVAAVIRRISAAQSSLGGGTMGDPAESDPRSVRRVVDGEDYTASEQLAEESALHLDPTAEDDCELSAFAPDRPRVLPFGKPFPPIFGGWALLDDLPTDGGLPEEDN